MPKTVKTAKIRVHRTQAAAKSAIKQRNTLHREERELRREQTGAVTPLSHSVEGTPAVALSAQLRNQDLGPVTQAALDEITRASNVAAQTTVSAVSKRTVNNKRRERRRQPYRSYLSSDADDKCSDDERSPSRGRQGQEKPSSPDRVVQLRGETRPHKTSSQDTTVQSLEEKRPQSPPHKSSSQDTSAQFREEERSQSPPPVLWKLHRISPSPHTSVQYRKEERPQSPPHKTSSQDASIHSREEKRAQSPPPVLWKLHRISPSPHNSDKASEYVVVQEDTSPKQVRSGEKGSLKRQSSWLDSDESCRQVGKDSRRRISYHEYVRRKSGGKQSQVAASATAVPADTAAPSEVSAETVTSPTSDRRVVKARRQMSQRDARLAEVTAQIHARTMALTIERPYPKEKIMPTLPHHEATRCSRLAEMLTISEQRIKGDGVLRRLFAEKAAMLAAKIGLRETGALSIEPFGPPTTAALGQQTSAASTRPDGRFQYNLGQAEMPPGGQAQQHTVHQLYQHPGAIPQQVGWQAQSCPPAATAVAAPLPAVSHDVRTDRQYGSFHRHLTALPPTVVRQTLAEPPRSGPHPSGRRYGNERAGRHGQQQTSRSTPDVRRPSFGNENAGRRPAPRPSALQLSSRPAPLSARPLYTPEEIGQAIRLIRNSTNNRTTGVGDPVSPRGGA